MRLQVRCLRRAIPLQMRMGLHRDAKDVGADTVTIREDVDRSRELERELAEINERIGQMVPERPALYDNAQMAHVYSAQAARGCQQAARYLELAIKEAMPT